MVFNVEVDPSEQFPLTSNGTEPSDPAVAAVLAFANASYALYMSEYVPGELTRANGGLADDSEEEIVNGTAYYGVCCARQSGNTCDCDGAPFS